MRNVRLFFALFFLAWLGLWLAKTWSLDRAADQTTDIHVSSGYLKTVDLFIRHDWLEYSRGEIETNFPDNSGGKALDRFYRQSYLARDVAAFNRGNRSVFRIENNRVVGIDPYRHNVPLPFTERSPWRGNLTYRPVEKTRASLKGENEIFALQHPTQNLSNQVALERVPLSRPRRDGLSRFATGEGFELYGDGVLLGKTHLVGNSVIYNNRDAGDVAEVFVNGLQVRQGNRARLDTGDLIKFEWKTNNTNRYALLWNTVTEDAQAIVNFRSVNGKLIHSPSRPEPQWLSDLLSALNNSFASESVPEKRNDFDIALTLDADLQEVLQQRLSDYCMDLKGKMGRRKSQMFRGAITVMDTTTGDLLALASFPEKEHLASMEGSSAAKARLLRNHNFSKLAMGSVAKVFFSAALLHAHPELADLEIPGYQQREFDRLLGIEIKPALSDHPVRHGGDGWVNFDEFMEYSSNKYAAILLTLGTAYAEGAMKWQESGGELNDKLNPDEYFRLGREHTRRPKLNLRLSNHKDTVRATKTTTLEFLPYAKALYDIFETPVTQKARVDRSRGDSLFDTTLWTPLLTHLYGEDIPRSHAFYGIAPERENLALNLSGDYRTEYISLILGGGSSICSNIKTAEIFSSLVMNQRIRPNLVERLQSRRANQQPKTTKKQKLQDLPIDPRARRKVLDATVRVTSPTGTARRLNKLLRGYKAQLNKEGKTLGFFSKTGSPTNVTYVPGQTAKAMNGLIANGAFRIGKGGQIVYRNKGVVTDQIDRDTGELIFARALRQNKADAAVLRKFGVGPSLLISTCFGYNRGGVHRERSPLVVKNNKLVRLDSGKEVESIGAVYTFTMGIYPKHAERAPAGTNYLPRIDPNQQPERAITVSIVIETVGNSSIAVTLAKKLIEEVLWDELQQTR